MTPFLRKVVEVGTAMAQSRIVWEKKLGTKKPDYCLDAGGFRRLSYFQWKGEVALFRISCPCGSKSPLIPCLCESTDQSIELVSKCSQDNCGMPLVSEVRFVLDP